MERRSMRVCVLAFSFMLVLALFFSIVRPWYLNWGSTSADVVNPLPGDEIIPNATASTTRGVTIDAGAESVWPWVAQIGQDRGGFYSFDLLENLVGCRMPTVDVLRPEKQSWQLGDKLWMYPPDRAGGQGFATLRVYVPGRALGFATRAVGTPVTAAENGSWAFVVQPMDPYTTRLVFRGRGAPRSWGGVMFDRSIFEPLHFVMERRTLLGIKQLAEEQDRHRWANHLQVWLWMATFALFVYSAVLVIRRREWERPLGAFVASAAVFQILTLVQPHVAVGLVLVAALASILWWPHQGAVHLVGERAIIST